MMWRSRSFQLQSLWSRRFTTGCLFPCHRPAGTVVPLEPTIKLGDVYEGAEIEGFVAQQMQNVPEFNLTAVTLTHTLTGAEYLHLFRNDSNNAFCVGFRTTPFDSTGLSHILEHTTLCGSGRYPCRDPFFKMLNRSMATFMNALTGPDYTLYPFTTQNIHDYKNLMSVYLDAVFNPRLREIDFRQEGWRLEYEDLNDDKSPIIFKGVVFNEMKGVFSHPSTVFQQALLNNILPSHTYGHISGGDPNKIPLLTYKDLKAFHQRYYNPRNARFYSYGNFPLINHLKFISQNYLDTSHGKDIPNSASTMVPSEQRWTTQRCKHISCRFDPLAANPEKQSTIAISLLLDDIKDLESAFDWHILSSLLVSGPNSSFYKSLFEQQIGSGFAPSTGFSADTRDTFFSVGLQGVSSKDFDKVVNIFDSTVNSVIESGFEQAVIDGVLHFIELNIKHEVSNFGLGMLFSLNPLWNHQGDIMKALRVNEQLVNFKQRLNNNPKYLQEIIEEKLKGNPHRLILTMSPNESYEESLKAEEKSLLDSKIKNFSVNDKKKIFIQGLELLEEQSNQQNAACLPSLRVCHLNKNVEATVLDDVTIGSVPVQCSKQSTNKIVYFRGILNVSHLSVKQKALLSLFASVVNKMGTKKCTYHKMDERIQLKTGGINFTPHLMYNLNNLGTFEEGIVFSSYALEHNTSEMFGILSEMFNEFSLADINRLKTLIRMSATDLANSIVDSGHLYAMLSAGSLISGSTAYNEMISGLTYVDNLCHISRLEDLSGIVKQLKEIAASVLNKEHLRCAVNYTECSESSVLKTTEVFLSSIPGKASEPLVLSTVPQVNHDYKNIHHVIPSSVNFASKALQAVEFKHKDHAPLVILAKLLSSKYLHPEIREKGGAYGSGATVTPAGNLTFYSYRDPNTSSTFDVFDNSIKWLNKGSFLEEDIEEAKLGVFQKLDAPLSPEHKGMARFLQNISDSVLQEHRNLLREVTKEDILAVAEKYLSEKSGQKCARALLGPANSNLLTTHDKESWIVKSHD